MALELSPFVFQIAGYQNSGKTTLTEKVIAGLADLGESAVTIKHHGHGGRPDVAANKDSSRHMAAGAKASIVEGEGRLLLHAENNHWSLEAQIELASSFQPDFIIIEGHKKAQYPKVLLLKNISEIPLFQQSVNVKAVFCWDMEIAAELKGIPVFSIDDDSGLEWLISCLHARDFH